MTADKVALRAQWGTTDTGRKARIYTITPVGRVSSMKKNRRGLNLSHAIGQSAPFCLGTHVNPSTLWNVVRRARLDDEVRQEARLISRSSRTKNEPVG